MYNNPTDHAGSHQDVFTYIIRIAGTGLYKIGRTKNPHKRLSAIYYKYRRISPLNHVCLIAFYPNDIEKRVHEIIRRTNPKAQPDKEFGEEVFLLSKSDIDLIINTIGFLRPEDNGGIPS